METSECKDLPAATVQTLISSVLRVKSGDDYTALSKITSCEDVKEQGLCEAAHTMTGGLPAAQFCPKACGHKCEGMKARTELLSGKGSNPTPAPTAAPTFSAHWYSVTHKGTHQSGRYDSHMGWGPGEEQETLYGKYDSEH